MRSTIQLFFEACHPFGYPLLVCSIALLAAIIYHLFSRISESELRRLSALTKSLNEEGRNMHDIQQELCHARSAPLSRLIDFVIQQKNSPSLQELTESRLRLFIDSQRNGMTLISIIANIAPMLGILGTAWGLVDIFGVFGVPGAEQSIALGISKALYTTIFGLAIAVPGIIALACFERTLERRAALIDEFFTDLLSRSNEL